jgi:predicted ATPase
MRAKKTGASKEAKVSRPVPFPQANDTNKIRALVDGLALGGTVTQAAVGAGLITRHIGYYLNAAKSLGFVDASDGVTALGKKLERAPKDSPEEIALWRRGILACGAVMAVAPSLLEPASAPNTPEKLDAAIRVAFPALSAATVQRRRSTLLAWRKFVLRLETNPVLPLQPPAVAYNERLTLVSLAIDSFKAFGATATKKTPKSRSASPPIELRPLTVFAGPNGVGKTTILQALDVLGAVTRMSTQEMLDEHKWEYDDLPHLLADNRKMTIAATLETTAGSHVRWTLVLGAKRYPGIHSERVECRRSGGEWHCVLERQGRAIVVIDEQTQAKEEQKLTLPKSWISTREASDLDERKKYPTLLALKAWAEGIVPFWPLQPSSLRTPSRAEAATRIGPLGEDLSGFLFDLKKNRAKQFAAFLKRVRTHYPRLVNIEHKSGRGGLKHLEITERWNGKEATFNARQVSDGLLRILVVASIPY